MADAKQMLVDWANGQQGWIKLVAKEVLETRSAIPEEVLEEIYNHFLIEKGLNQGEVPAVDNLAFIEEAGNQSEKFFLKELNGVNNVNKLTSNQTLVFNPGVTVIFGENASGKSGYVRILKRLAGTRSQETILPDVTRVTPSGPPEALISYQVGELAENATWKGDGGVAPFNRVGIFDSRSLLFHVDGDQTYFYTPRDLSLFKLTHTSIEWIKSRLDADRRKLKPAGNPFLISFNKESSIYRLIETVGPTTDLRELGDLAKFGPEEEARLGPLREQVEALNSQNIDARLEQAEARRALLNQGVALAKTVQNFNVDAYNNAVDRFSSAREKHSQATEKAFLGESIPGLLTESWKKFIEAGDDFLKANDFKSYPQESDHCIYCRQPLEAAAVDLLKKYNAFCNDTLKADVKKVQQEIETISSSLNYPDVESYIKLLQKKIANPDSQNRELLQMKLKLATEFRTLVATCKQMTSIKTSELNTLSSTILSQCAPLTAAVDELIASLKKQGGDRKTALSQKVPELRTLEGRKTLNALFPEIKVYVENAKWVSKAETVSSVFLQLLRSLTTQSKVASEDLLNKDFQALFEKECLALKAPKVKLDFPGQRGEPARRKSLSTRAKLSDILSEGEQKVIALSDFLAETSIRKASSPLVFDDPVNSLDHKRIEYIADRISQLSHDQQVIVFTHNIWFATSLLSRFEEEPSRCTYYDIADSGGVPGFIRTGSHPRWDTVKVLKGNINDLIQSAGAADGQTQLALIEKAYDKLRSWCEVVVEQELLNKVSQRYTPHISMGRLAEIKVQHFAVARDAIVEIFDKCCRVMAGHSQPLETLSIRPTIDELKGDWNTALTALENYRKA